VYPNPSVSYSREGAGYNEFFEASQTLPLNRRIRYLRDAGVAAVSVADASREAALWSLRSDLRLAFYRMVAAQERVRLLSASVGDVEQLIGLLRRREEEGEGSHYDRLRAEREVTELRTDVVAGNALIAAAGARVNGFLPDGAHVEKVQGTLPVLSEPPAWKNFVLAPSRPGPTTAPSRRPRAVQPKNAAQRLFPAIRRCQRD
jgi:outer membrane protein TolC